MSFLGRRNGGLYNLRDGSKLAWEIDDAIAQPMIRLTSDCHAYLREATNVGIHGWFYPRKWFEEDGKIFGEGPRLRRLSDCFVLQEDWAQFSADLIVRSSVSKETRSIPICESCISIVNTPLREVVDDGDTEISSLENGEWTHPDRALAAGRPIYYVPVLGQTDDVSGNVSKKWNVHYAVNFTNAALDRDAMQMSGSVTFFAISQSATPLELMQGWTAQMK
jgi:hypothetical protein